MWSRRWSRRGELTLAGQFLVLQLAVVAVLLGIVAVLSFRQSTVEFTNEQGTQMREVAEHTANLEPLRIHLARARTSDVRRDSTAPTLAPYVDRGVSLSGATVVYVVDPAGAIVAASEPSLVGVDAELGESDALEGRGWSGDVEVDGERTVAAHAPIYANDGEVLGVVVAEETYPSVVDRLTGGASDLAAFLGVGALLGVLGTFVVSRVVKRRTRGLAPTEIAQLADHREALLHAIREGVVAVAPDGRVTMMNDAARATLGLDGPQDPVGRPIAGLGLDPHVVDLLTGAVAAEDAVAVVGSRAVVFNRREASAGGHGIGSVTTLRDRTELVSLQSRLGANLAITDTLRAQTHEFDNRLHTISGLVQLGEYDEVTRLVGTLTRHRAEVAAHVSQRVADPALVALLLAKHAVAEERGVLLELDPGSSLPRLADAQVADLTTILGNLVDNAVDACAGHPDALVEVWLFVDGRELHVRVRDNGPGVPDELAETVFVRGFSTKPEPLAGRGLGLALVRLVCAQRGGEVTLTRTADRQDGERGAEFLVVLPLDEREDDA